MHFEDCYEAYPLPVADCKLGINFKSDGVSAVFNIWAPNADEVCLQLYRMHEFSSIAFFSEYPPDYTCPLHYCKDTGVWSVEIPVSDYIHAQYDYSILRNGKKSSVMDPYARAASLNRTRERGFISPTRGIILNPDLVHKPVERAAGMVFPCDSVVYELHIRDFSIADSENAVPGTFAACIQKIPYLLDLGVTHVQILPVLKTAYIDECGQIFGDSSDQFHNYNWGYDPLSFFALNNWYAEHPADPYSAIHGLQELVHELHSVGIRVILDVVYNHMAEASILENIVPGYYFRREYDGNLRSDSQCGNDIASARFMARKLLCDSVSYLASNFGVDGFRFDLMGLLDAETVLAAKAAAESASGRSDLFFLGEGWRMYRGLHNLVMMDQNFMQYTDEVAVFNDELRDLLKAGGAREEGRGFVHGSEVDINTLVQNLLGNPVDYFQVMSPRSLVQYATAHDGLTLHDSIAHNCKLDDSDPKDTAEIDKRICLANFLLLCSQGCIMLHSGQEIARSKPAFNASDGDDTDSSVIGAYIANSYASGDWVNALPVTLTERQERLFNYTSGLIHARKQMAVFQMGSSRVIEKRSLHIKSKNPLMLAYVLREKETFYLVCANSGCNTVELQLPDALMNRRLFDARISVLIDPVSVRLDGIDNPRGVRINGTRIILEGLSWALLSIHTNGN